MKRTARVGTILFVIAVFGVGLLSRRGPAGVELVANAAAHQGDEDSSIRECSLGTIQGSYGESTTGWIVFGGPIGPVADVGVITFDGNGGASQTSTVSLNGTIIPTRTSLNGSYEVHPDCTGNITLILPGPMGPITSKSNLVIVKHGQELRTIVTGDGRVLAGTAERQ
jgi:hypothetical protein